MNMTAATAHATPDPTEGDTAAANERRAWEQLNEGSDSSSDDGAGAMFGTISDSDTSSDNESGMSSGGEVDAQRKKGSQCDLHVAKLHNAYTNEGGADAMVQYTKKITRAVHEQSSSKKLAKRNGDPVKTWNGAKLKLKLLRKAFFAKHGPELVSGLPAAIGPTQNEILNDSSLNADAKVSLIEECRAFVNAGPQGRYAVWHKEGKKPPTARGHIYKLSHEDNELETAVYQAFSLPLLFPTELEREMKLSGNIRDSKHQIIGGETAVAIPDRQAFHENTLAVFHSYLRDLEKEEAPKKDGPDGKTADAKAKRASSMYINSRDIRYTFQQFAKILSAYNVGVRFCEVMPGYAMSSPGVLATRFMGNDDGIFKETDDLRMLTLNYSNKVAGLFGSTPKPCMLGADRVARAKIVFDRWFD